MNDNLKYFCILFVSFVLVAIIVTVVYHIIRKYINGIKNKSACIQKLDLLNVYYRKIFHEFNTYYTSTKHHKSKASFDKANLTALMQEYVYLNLDLFKSLIKDLDENLLYLEAYSKACDEIYQNNITEWKYNFQRRTEKKLFEKNKLKPFCSLSIEIFSRYVSPAGRNRYFDSKIFTASSIRNAIMLADNKKNYAAQKNAERAKMTDSLRYDVLKRDGFRCVICGASADDGAKLHVDHIKPVSKGGKTELKNLRTLCESCNLGKGAKYDSRGIN